MKKCPFCAEEVTDDATKCIHCDSLLTLEKQRTVHPHVENKNEQIRFIEDNWKKTEDEIKSKYKLVAITGWLIIGTVNLLLIFKLAEQPFVRFLGIYSEGFYMIGQLIIFFITLVIFHLLVGVKYKSKLEREKGKYLKDIELAKLGIKEQYDIYNQL